MNQSRRDFLTFKSFNVKDVLVDTVRALSAEVSDRSDSTAPDLSDDSSYFSSFESCYAFLAEVSLEELQQDALQLGMDPAGKDKYQIAKLIFEREKQAPVTETGR